MQHRVNLYKYQETKEFLYESDENSFKMTTKEGYTSLINVNYLE